MSLKILSFFWEGYQVFKNLKMGHQTVKLEGFRQQYRKNIDIIFLRLILL